MARASFEPRYTGIARFPAVSRDLSMVVPNDITAQDIDDIIVQRTGKILEAYRLFDVYEGEQIGNGFKSMAYTIVFRDKEKTLSDEDVNLAMRKILHGLRNLGIELRS